MELMMNIRDREATNECKSMRLAIGEGHFAHQKGGNKTRIRK